MSDALERVKADLGRDAVILHTRTIKAGGVFGVGSRAVVEITATRDLHVGDALDKPSVRLPAKVGVTIPREFLNGRALTAGPPVSPRAIDPPIDNRVRVEADRGVRAEVDEIRSMVAQLLREAQSSKAPTLPAELVDYYTSLIGQDVSAELARQILERISARLGVSAAPSSSAKRAAPTDDRMRSELLTCLTEMLPPGGPIQLTAKNRPTVVALVGPTGVGKTTTVAKLAAVMKLREGRRVGLITIDTYRIAAVEQLRTYAQILDVPLISVMQPGEMKSAIGRMADRDLILIDTAGRSQRDDARIDELQKFLAAAEPDQVHLVLLTTSREETIRQAAERFTAVGAGHVVFTKLDEAVGLGVMLNVLHTVKLKLSYLTSGQAVPDDIETGSAKRVAELIVANLRLSEAGASGKTARGALRLGGRI